MNLFLSYRHTGEDLTQLENTIKKLEQSLVTAGFEVFCSFWKDQDFKNNGLSVKDIYKYCLEEMEKQDIILFFINSLQESQGMNIELEHSYNLNKKRILVINKNLEYLSFRQAADHIIEFEDIEDLCKSLSVLKI